MDVNSASISVLIIFAFWLAILILMFHEDAPFNLFGEKSRRRRITIGMIFNWGRNADTAIAQITKEYEWRIAQWSALGSALLTAGLAFLSTVAVSAFKGEFKMELTVVMPIIVLGIICTAQSYILCQMTINRLRREFLYLYDLLLELKKKKRN